VGQGGVDMITSEGNPSYPCKCGGGSNKMFWNPFGANFGLGYQPIAGVRPPGKTKPIPPPHPTPTGAQFSEEGTFLRDFSLWLKQVEE